MNTGAKRNLLKMLFPVLLVSAAAAQVQPRPAMAKKPLTPDQIAVYRAFLKQYLSEDSGSKGMLNIARTTTPFKAEASELNGGCLKDFKPLNVTSGVHAFTDQFADMKNVRVVNARETADHGISAPKASEAILQQGLLTFSEVIFDPTHQYAAVSYSFERPMWGNGGIEVFTLDHGVWKPTRRNCTISSWMA